MNRAFKFIYANVNFNRKLLVIFVAHQTHTGTNGSIAEGVQQPYEISVVTAIEEAPGINLSVTAYPNPTRLSYIEHC